uniref:Uncharacterized protein n=1 Tax=viral metagenome TaxID=1070528 RepID=A0A6H1ZFV9_9ZZZZ
MRLKIISGGHSTDTEIINEETGEPLKNVKSITWQIATGQMAEVTLELMKIPVELIGETKEIS